MKKISDNQMGGYIGENEFRLWASKMGWFPTKLEHDHGLDFVCQIEGKQITERASEMPGNMLTVSVRSTDGSGDAVTITRDDAELLLSTNVPMVFAIVLRGAQDEQGRVALKFPDENFIRQLDAFFRSGAQRYQLRFSEGITDVGKIRYNTERLFRESFSDRLTRLRATLRAEGLIPDPHVEIVNTEAGRRGILRSPGIASISDISSQPELEKAVQDLGIPFALYPSTTHGLQITTEVMGRVESAPRVEGEAIANCDLSPRVEQPVSAQGVMTPDPPKPMSLDSFRRHVDRISQALAVWNFADAVRHAEILEGMLSSERLLDDSLVMSAMILIARARMSFVDAGHRDNDSIERISLMLNKALSLASPGEQQNEIHSLQAALTGVREGPTVGLAYLDGRTDQFSIRTRIAILLNQQSHGEALAVVEAASNHEWWCDLGVLTRALNDKLDKAQEMVRWVAGLSNRNRYYQSCVRLGEGALSSVVRGHPSGENILPEALTESEREKLLVAADAVGPLLSIIQAAGKPVSGLEMAALQVSWRVNYLLQRRAAAAEALALMALWTPLPIDVARGVIGGYISVAPDMPERLRRDHPKDFEAGLLAAIIESDRLGRKQDAFSHANELVVLAESAAQKEELFKLFHALWQELDGAEAEECRLFAEPLVAEIPILRTTFHAALALRRNDPDAAIAMLDGHRAQDDLFWLQMRANACLQKGQLSEGVDYLLPVAQKTLSPGLLSRTGDLAMRVQRNNDAVWCYERLLEKQPDNIAVRGNLAHIFTVDLHDLKRASEQFQALHAIQPDDPTHLLNLAVCLAQLFRPEESLQRYDELCRLESPPLNAVLGRAQLHHAMGRPECALASMDAVRARFWSDPTFVSAYMNEAYAAGREDAAHEAFVALNELQNGGGVKPEIFRALSKDEGIEMLKQSLRQEHERNQHLHGEMLNGRMPWVWAERVANGAIYRGWRNRTQEFLWIGDDLANRAQFSIYATNHFHPRASDEGGRELLPLECPSAGTKVVADISALITLHRLDLLDAAADYFGEILVPAGYLPSVLEDSRRMVLHQRSRQQCAERILKLINSGQIKVVSSDAAKPVVVVDEYAEGEEHLYRLADLIQPIYAAGAVTDAQLSRISRVGGKPSAVDEQHPALVHYQEVVVDLTTMQALAGVGVLESVTGFYSVRIREEDRREVVQQLDAIAMQEETRQWHLDLWGKLRANPRFKFVPHKFPASLKNADNPDADLLAFLACFVAMESKIPLLADDRVCQAFTMNSAEGASGSAFGSDTLIIGLAESGRLAGEKAADAFRQLMSWRYRFVVPTPEILKAMADANRGNAPGQALRDVAMYVHDCMRDAGMFGGRENTELGDSMAIRTFMVWISVISDFLVLVWSDDEYPAEAATALTQWACTELLPSSPRVAEGPMKSRSGELTPRLFLSHALVKMAFGPVKQRLADGVKAMKDGLRLEDEDYHRIVMSILNDTTRG